MSKRLVSISYRTTGSPSSSSTTATPHYVDWLSIILWVLDEKVTGPATKGLDVLLIAKDKLHLLEYRLLFILTKAVAFLRIDLKLTVGWAIPGTQTVKC